PEPSTSTTEAPPRNLPPRRPSQTVTPPGGPRDRLLCDPADNGGFVEGGTCVLPDAVLGQPYQGHLVTSHKAGGTLKVVAGALPPGPSLTAPLRAARRGGRRDRRPPGSFPLHRPGPRAPR